MSTLLRGALVLPDGVVEDGEVVLEGDRIGYAGPAVPGRTGAVDLPEDVLLLPGLVDMHCHGGGGAEFGPDVEAARQAAEHHHRSGTTSVVASLMSAPADRLVAGMQTCAGLAADGVLAAVHTEGPFLAVERCGAQDPAALQPVDLDLVDALVRAGSGYWRMMTLAPELPGTDALLPRLAVHSVRPALGHTIATAAQMRAALAAAREAVQAPPVVTHLFNGMPPFHHREPGPAAAALAAAAEAGAVVELVGDGVHLDDQVVAMVFDVAAEGCVALITDAMAACGMPDGRYTLGGQDVIVSDRTARLQNTGAIAGGVATLLDVVRRAVLEAGVPLVSAVAAASAIPARTLGLDPDVGSLVTGGRADVVAVDHDLRLLQVWRHGMSLLA